MADAYPWGSQAPAARLSKLQRDLTKNTEAKSSYLDAHKAKMAEFDETDRKLKSDIRACEGVIEKEKIEAQSEQLGKLVKRLAGSGKVDVEKLLADPDLEKKLAAIANANAGGGEGGGSKKAAKKPAEAGAGEKVEA